MYRPSAERLCVTQRTKPTKSTMNEAPSRDPLIIANASRSDIVPEAKRLSEIAATGEPLITMYEPNQPNPSRFSTPSAEKRERTGERPTAPAVSSSSAKMKRNKPARL